MHLGFWFSFNQWLKPKQTLTCFIMSWMQHMIHGGRKYMSIDSFYHHSPGSNYNWTYRKQYFKSMLQILMNQINLFNEKLKKKIQHWLLICDITVSVTLSWEKWNESSLKRKAVSEYIELSISSKVLALSVLLLFNCPSTRLVSLRWCARF